MPKFSVKSDKKLSSCHFDIQRVMREVIKMYDFTVIYGERNEEDQNEAFAKGNSTKQWPDSRHNTNPSLAIDIAPWPVNWDDPRPFIYLAGLVIATANSIGIRLRWGGNWDEDYTIITDQTFQDLGHYEIVSSHQ